MPVNDEVLRDSNKIVVILGKLPGKLPFIVGVWSDDCAPTYEQAQRGLIEATGDDLCICIYKPIEPNVSLAECLNLDS